MEQRQIKELPKSVGEEVVSVDVTKVLTETDVLDRVNLRQAGRLTKEPLKLFVSYAHEDEKWRAKLAPNLALLEREGLVEVWCDLQIKPGDKWDNEIKRKLEQTDLYLILMSTDLLVSEYVQKTELAIARQRHEKRQARLVPVVVRRCSWANYLGQIEGLPKGGRPVKEWTDKDQAFHNVETGLRLAISEMYALRGRS